MNLYLTSRVAGRLRELSHQATALSSSNQSSGLATLQRAGKSKQVAAIDVSNQKSIQVTRQLDESPREMRTESNSSRWCLPGTLSCSSKRFLPIIAFGQKTFLRPKSREVFLYLNYLAFSFVLFSASSPGPTMCCGTVRLIR
jgi:hypothetical protein